jgi:hypothetical protein
VPSSQTNAASGNLVSGVSSVAFIGHQLYALLTGAGCSHGVPTIPNGVIKVGHHGRWKLIADLSAFQKAHPVAHPDPGDFEPDGTWYSMIAIGRALYPMDSNHGELDRVTPYGTISRVIDISASQGHVVPTALTYHHGIYIANLGVFEPSDRAGDEHVWRLTGHRTLKVRATGVEKVLVRVAGAFSLVAWPLIRYCNCSERSGRWARHPWMSPWNPPRRVPMIFGVWLPSRWPYGEWRR